jgi:hypothetical protein
MRNFYRGPSTHLNRWEEEALARKLVPIVSEQTRRSQCSSAPQRREVLSDVEIAAWHEAGHAVVARVLGQPVDEMFITDGGGGGIWHKPKSERRSGIETEDLRRPLEDAGADIEPSQRMVELFFPTLAVAAAGWIAQLRAAGDRPFEYHSKTCSSDRHHLNTVARAVTETPEAALALVIRAERKAIDVLEEHWPAVRVLARELIQHRRMYASHISNVLKPYGLGAVPLDKRFNDGDGKPILTDVRWDGHFL